MSDGLNKQEIKMKKMKRKVLADGEVTGHAHRVTVDVYETEENTKVFSGKTKVTHEEHGPITLPNKEWESDQVQEFDYFANEARKVED